MEISKRCLAGTISREHIRQTRETFISTNKRPLDSHSEKRVTKSNVYTCIRQSLERICCNIHVQLERYCTRQMNTTFGAESMARTKTQDSRNTPKQHRTTPNTAEHSGTPPRQPAKTDNRELSKGVFQWRMWTGSKTFPLLICLDNIKFVSLSFFTLIEAIWLKIWAKSLPVDVHRSKTSLLTLPIRLI